MLTVVIFLALLVGGLIAGEVVRGQCRRMLSRPHPSLLALRAEPSADAAAEQPAQA